MYAKILKSIKKDPREASLGCFGPRRSGDVCAPRLPADDADAKDRIGVEVRAFARKLFQFGNRAVFNLLDVIGPGTEVQDPPVELAPYAHAHRMAGQFLGQTDIQQVRKVCIK